jgi:hypothetical protein
MNRELLHYYRRARAYQLANYSNSNLHDEHGHDLRQFTGGSAAYGWHAYAALREAKREIHFRADLAELFGATKED